MQRIFNSLLLLSIFCLTLISCLVDEKGKGWSIVQSGGVTFPLDSLTGFYSFSIQYCKDFSGDFVYIGNHQNSSISVYDFKSRRKVESIPLFKDGPNNVGTTPWAFYRIASDSIFILSHWEGLASIVNHNGIVSKKKLLIRDAWAGDPIPWASTDIPMSISDSGKSLLIPGVARVPIKGYSSSYSLINWELKSDSVSYAINFPKIYDKGYWVDDSFIKCYWTFDLNNRMIYAFAADPFIRTSSNQYEAKSSYLGELKPVTEKYDPKFPPDVSQRHVYLSGYYSTIIADKVNRVYYRFVYHPIDEDSFNQGERHFQSSVIILDENFRKKGETRLPKGYAPYMFFLNDEGLYIANEAAYKLNEDSLRFDRFIIEK